MARMQSAYSVASGKGFAFLDPDGGEGGKRPLDKGIWFSKFFKNRERTGPCLFVGYSHRLKRWHVYYDLLPEPETVGQ